MNPADHGIPRRPGWRPMQADLGVDPGLDPPDPPAPMSWAFEGYEGFVEPLALLATESEAGCSCRLERFSRPGAT
jgi:hypothetical protein